MLNYSLFKNCRLIRCVTFFLYVSVYNNMEKSEWKKTNTCIVTFPSFFIMFILLSTQHFAAIMGSILGGYANGSTCNLHLMTWTGDYLDLPFGKIDCDSLFVLYLLYKEITKKRHKPISKNCRCWSMQASLTDRKVEVRMWGGIWGRKGLMREQTGSWDASK